MSSVLFLATEWSEKKGGVNALNRDLALGCGRKCKTRYRIVCCVPEATAEQIQAANEEGVRLLSLRSETGVASFDLVGLTQISAFLGREENKCEYVVGHDIFTGRIAIEVANKIGARSVLFIHSNYGSYKAIQDGGDGERTSEKEKLQAELVNAASRVFGVGPFLTEAARNMVEIKSKKQRRSVRNFLPGLPSIEPLDVDGKFSAFTFGRYEGRNDVLKQPQLPVAAYAEFVSKIRHDLSDKSLTIVGLSSDERERKEQIRGLYGLVDESDEGAINLNCLPFLPREHAWELLRKATISMMLSWHEGFGLVGWESIGAGVPLVLSQRSGLFRFLDEKYDHLGACYWSVHVRGKFGGGVNPADVDDVSLILYKMHGKQHRLRHRARFLRMELLKTYAWPKRARVFLKALDPRGFHFSAVRKERKDAA